MSSEESLQWRRNERDGVWNYQPHHCLLNLLIRRESKKTSKLRITGLCEGNSPVTGEFPAQKASNAENVFIWWRHHDIGHLVLTSMPRYSASIISLCLCWAVYGQTSFKWHVVYQAAFLEGWHNHYLLLYIHTYIHPLRLNRNAGSFDKPLLLAV